LVFHEEGCHIVCGLQAIGAYLGPCGYILCDCYNDGKPLATPRVYFYFAFVHKFQAQNGKP